MLDKAYEAKKYEDDIYKKWEESGAFQANADSGKPPFTISMPPPNATGVLHLGHSVLLALEDILIRHRRMKGYEALWLPGTDHAAIATQNRVEKDIIAEGLTREQMGREAFLERVKEFVADSQDTIRNQIRKMGASCDWSRERYTLDDDLSKAVIEVFNRMYEDKLIYRGYRIVNWCTRCHSTLADDEVEYTEKTGSFYYIKYGPFVIGTARPEAKYLDNVVTVHPDDERYKKYHGKTFEIDWIGDEKLTVTCFPHEMVDPDWGTGANTITPAHCFPDFELAQEHGFDIVQTINEEGKLTEVNGKFAGLTVKEAREKFVETLKEKGLLVKIDQNYVHNLSVCYRCNTPVEPLVSDQWFIDVNKKLEKFDNKSIKEKSIEVVKNNSIEIIPDRFNKTYFHWMENLRDWCISRQIWWGHRIPVWYCEGGDDCKPECKNPIVSRETPKECPHCKTKKLRQDEDTLDTWFSSGLWTFSTLGWPEKTKDLEYFHPTSVLETGYDIIFFWVARMIIMTTYTLDEIPFETVYLHGLIRTREGKKMSKSDPKTCIDPLDMIDKYGADALRMSMVIGNTPGNDMRLYEEKIKGYRNFTNKLWNASRFVMGILEEKGITEEPQIDHKNLTDADQWILDKLNEVIQSGDKGLMDFRISDVGQTFYDFLWNDFCDWYLELSKGDKQNPAVLYYVLKNILILLHPFIPFVTEAIWSNLPGQKKMLIEQVYPQIGDQKYNDIPIVRTIDVITKIRHLRSENKIEPIHKIPITIYAHKYFNDLERNKEEIIRLARISELTLQEKGKKLTNAATDVVSGIEIFIPLEGLVDTEKEKERLQKEIEKLGQYAENLNRKLSNKKFVQNAPSDIVERERKNLEEAKNKVGKMKEQLGNL